MGTVGGEDFATLAAAEAALKGLILTVNLTVQLTGDITLTSDATFDGLISAGGALVIDLNGHNLSIDDGCTFGLNMVGPFKMTVLTTGGASSIIMVASSLNPPYYMVSAQDGAYLD